MVTSTSSAEVHGIVGFGLEPGGEVSMSEEFARNEHDLESIRGRIQLNQPLPADGRVRLISDRLGQVAILADVLIGPDGLFSLDYRLPRDPGEVRIEVLTPEAEEPLLSHDLPQSPAGTFLEIRADAVQGMDPAYLFTPPLPTVYWRDTYPIAPEQVRVSQDAMRQAYESYNDSSRGLDDRPGLYPWRYQLNPTTRLPTLVRRRLPTPPSPVNAAETVAAAVRTPNFTSALFGVDLSQEFDRNFQPQSLIQMAVESGSRSMEENTHYSWQQVYQATDGKSYPVLGGGFRVHSKTNMTSVSVTNSYFPIQAEGLFPAPKVVDNDLFDIGLKSLFISAGESHTQFLDAIREFWSESRIPLLQRFLSQVGAFLLRRQPKVRLAEKKRIFFSFRQADGKEKAYPLAILPYGGRYYLVARVGVRFADEEAWYMDIDVNERQVVGGAWQSVASAPDYFISSEDAAGGTPSGRFPNPELGFDDEPAPPLVKMPLEPSVERATFAVHAHCFYTHLITTCAAGSRLVQSMDEQPHFQLVLDSKFSKFVYDPSTSPKEIHLRKGATDDIGILADGKPIFHPSWDPELIVHELAHAFFWLLNDDPWQNPQTIAPFSRALHEGYAVYLARSFAAGDKPQQDDVPWASGVYRPENWQTRWLLRRDSRIVGADLLRRPNNYPARSFRPGQQEIDWEDYDIGMIWARALWDLRQLLGPGQTDYLAVQAYPYLHGAIVNLQTAAEALIEADARKDRLNVAAAVEPIWSTRGLTSDVGVFAIVRGPNGHLFAGSEQGVLMHTGNGWVRDPASWQDVKLASVESLAVQGNRLFAVATPPRGNLGDGVPEWNVGLYVRENGLWQIHSMPDGVTILSVHIVDGALLLATTNGVYLHSSGAWQQVINTSNLEPDQNSTQISDLSHWVAGNGQGWLIAARPKHVARIRFPLTADSRWIASLMPGDSRPSALVLWQNRLYIGTLEQGIWEYANGAPVQTGFVPPESAVLALVASNTWLIWSTPEEVGWSDGNISRRVIPPCATGIVVSLWVDADETLWAGTLAHGIWRLRLTDALLTWSAEHLPAESTELSVDPQKMTFISYFHRQTNPSAAIVDLPGEITVESLAQPGFPLQMRLPDANRQVSIEAGWVILSVRNHLDVPVQIVAHSDDGGRVIVERG